MFWKLIEYPINALNIMSSVQWVTSLNVKADATDGKTWVKSIAM